MATPSGSQDPDVAPYAEIEQLLRSVPQEFGFFQIVRLLERLYPDRSPVGTFVNPSREVVRFSANPEASFPASQVQDIEWREGEAPRVVVNFMGLNGPSGVMPLHYTQTIVERLRAKPQDAALRSFIDIFNHRIISLFYQGWEKYRFPIAYERGERDRFSHHLLDLIGLGTPGLQERQNVADDALLFYSGLLSMQPRSASALEQILCDYFDVPVEVVQFVGAWHEIDEETQCCFGKDGTCSEQLGMGAIVGDEIWDQQSGVRIRLGPLALAQYVEFLPHGSAHEPLRALVRMFSGTETDFTIQLVLKKGEVPPCELGVAEGVAPQLGWTTWASTRPVDYDPGDTILQI